MQSVSQRMRKAQKGELANLCNLSKAMNQNLQRELIEVIISKLTAIPHPTFQEVDHLSYRALKKIKDSKEQLISGISCGDSFFIRLHVPAFASALQEALLGCFLLDDVDRLLIFGASQSAIKELTGAHTNLIVERRQKLGLQFKASHRTKPRALDHDTKAIILRLWKKLEKMRVVDKTILIAETLDLEVYKIWPDIKRILSQNDDRKLRAHRQVWSGQSRHNGTLGAASS